MIQIINTQKMFKKASDFLGTPYPIIGGAMASISNHKWVAGMANAEAFPFIASGFHDAVYLDAEISKTKALTNKKFGVNIIVIHPGVNDLIDVCIKHGITHVTLAGSIPTPDMIKRLKEGGIKVLSFAPTLAIAKRLISMGVDALIIEGHESGGHIGPVSTIVLMQEILPFTKDDVPVFVAGGIGTGAMIAACLMLGAAGCQLGTSFICIDECEVHENFKKAYIRAASRSAVPTIQMSGDFPIFHVRSIYNQAHEDFKKHQLVVIEKFKNGELKANEAQLAIESFWAGALKKAVIDGDVETGSVMAGQIVGLVKQESTADEVVKRLVDETVKTLENVKEQLNEA